MVRQLEGAGDEVAFWGVLDTWTEENTRVRWKFHVSELWQRIVERRVAPVVRMTKGIFNRKPFAAPFDTVSSPAPAAHQGRREMYARYWPGSFFAPPVCQAQIIVFRVKKQS